MIEAGAYGTDPWKLTEKHLDLDLLPHSESVFALANGHIGLRGNLEEGEPVGVPGTYLNAFFELRPLPYAEAGYGYPESGQTLINVTDGKLIRLTVDDELFDIRYGQLARHERCLDFKTGILSREVEWASPIGSAVRIKTQRLVSFVQRNVAAILYEVEPIDEALRLVLQSELVANEAAPERSNDPRAAAALREPLSPEIHSTIGTSTAFLAHTTKQSGLHMGAAMGHVIEGPENTTDEVHAIDGLGRATIAASVEPGEKLRVVKLLAYGWSGHRSIDSVRAQVQGALAEARHTGWEGLAESQREYLDDFWGRADVEIDGDTEMQQAVRFANFHVLQAGARSEGRAIPAKGLTGPGYDGHAFWDSESMALRVLSYTAPEAVRDALMWRHDTLDMARDRAKELGLRGAAFPWRTIRGEECSAYWPAGTAAFHVNASIADAVRRYVMVSEDTEFEKGPGLEILVETARLWSSVGYRHKDGTFRIDGVTGPDEYSAITDDNVYTNLMAARNLAAAADAAETHASRAAELSVDDKEIESWRYDAENIVFPYDEDLGVHPQAEGFTDHEPWDFENTPAEDYPLLLNYPYFELYRRQVIKQADLVLALYSCGDRFTAEEKERNFAYYEPLTVRDSSLSAAVQSIVAAETGHLQLAYDYFGEAALIDLSDIAQNTKEGLHIASLSGAWMAVVAGFGGLRDHNGGLELAPQLPPGLERIAFRVTYRGRLLYVETTGDQATYSIRDDDEALELAHHGDAVTVEPGEKLTRDCPKRDVGEAPKQPKGRTPERRVPGGSKRD